MFSASLLLVFTVSLVYGDCPAGTIYSNQFNKCYLVVNNTLSFLNAEQNCQKYGAHLISLGNAFENSYLATLVGSSSYWIGANFLVNTQWSWINGNSFSYSNWAPGQPTDPSANQCAARRSTDGMWTKEQCNSARLSICSSSPNDPVPIDSCPPKSACNVTCSPYSTCSDEYVLFRATCQCYRLDVNNYSHKKAIKECENDGGHLAKITCPDLNKFLVNWIQNRSFNTVANVDTPWLGLICPDDKRAHCKWYDGTPLTGYNNFATDQPTGNSSYVQIDAYTDDDPKHWYTADGDSDDVAPLLCQRPPLNNFCAE